MSSHNAQLDAFQKLIATDEPPLLGPEKRSGTKSVAELNHALDTFFTQKTISSGTQDLLRSAALLWHDHVDASHTISQGIETRDGSWLHAIMHRREPDYGNAKYWFRRVGQHEAFPFVAKRVAELLHNDTRELAERLIESGEWMPLAFVDECERAEVRGNADKQKLLREIQTIEFDALVEHILRQSS
ncbi:MAG TPA: hypothetical protein VK530_02330 [Candidatus Acidoferrum sp.]|nr:hypothetical protein [Candidatus Acidoferrum sp.]